METQLVIEKEKKLEHIVNSIYFFFFLLKIGVWNSWPSCLKDVAAVTKSINKKEKKKASGWKEKRCFISFFSVWKIENCHWNDRAINPRYLSRKKDGKNNLSVPFPNGEGES